jgi:hypothetical protein
VNLAPIVRGKEQTQSRAVIIPPLAERASQASHPLDKVPDGSIQLGVRSAGTIHVGVAQHSLTAAAYYLAWGILGPRLPLFVAEHLMTCP